MSRIKKVPQRMCVGCREHKDKKELVRVVRTPERAVLLDFTGKAAGRGAYLCRSGECLARALKSKALEKALEVTVGTDLMEEIRRQLVGR